MSDILDLIARVGVAEALRDLASATETSFKREDLSNAFQNTGVIAPEEALDALLGLRLLQTRGGEGHLAISRAGNRVALLLEALEGGDIEDVFRRLRRLGGAPERYELVRQGMTSRFLDSLLQRPGFGRLYVCSPWINPSDKEAATLRYAMMQMQKGGAEPEVLVITRPPEDQKGITSEHNGLRPFTEVGAKIHYLKKVHTKLYIREPDLSGGYLMALVGSENLTQSNHLELGIQINGDGSLIGQLIAHFLELTSYASVIE